jgi:hypothetical protein
VKQIKKASESLKETHRQLVERLPGEKQLNIDESGWKENGEKRWTWAFRAKKYAVFIIRDSRGEGILEAILGLGYGGNNHERFFRGIPEVLPGVWSGDTILPGAFDTGSTVS